MKTDATPLIIIFLLLILYLLQGVVIGLVSTMPLYLDSYGAKWQQQGTFNFVFFPFSLKLVWAPIIDSVYIKRIGRRKTWLIPIQCLIGITLLILSFYLKNLIEELKIRLLTCIFFLMYFLLACQDICVDGWALTLLEDYNLQWASTCQTVGQTTGSFIGFTILMMFESANFTNHFVRKPFSISEKSSGLFTLNQFLLFWSVIFLIVSICLTFIIKETTEYDHLNLKKTYLSIWKLLRKPCVRQLAFLLLISPIGYAATYGMTNLVLKKYGVPKETVGLLGVPLILVKILVPFFIRNTNHPLMWFYRTYFPRLLMCLLIAIYVCFTPNILSQWYFYPILLLLFLINEAIIYLMLVSRVGFYARISDPTIGGTYITLLSMLGNLGASITTSMVLFTAGYIKSDRIAYPLLVGICFVCGCIWLCTQYKTIVKLQALSIEKWRLSSLKIESNQVDKDAKETCLNDRDIPSIQKLEIQENFLKSSEQ